MPSTVAWGTSVQYLSLNMSTEYVLACLLLLAHLPVFCSQLGLKLENPPSPAQFQTELPPPSDNAAWSYFYFCCRPMENLFHQLTCKWFEGTFILDFVVFLLLAIGTTSSSLKLCRLLHLNLLICLHVKLLLNFKMDCNLRYADGCSLGSK